MMRDILCFCSRRCSRITLSILEKAAGVDLGRYRDSTHSQSTTSVLKKTQQVLRYNIVYHREILPALSRQATHQPG